MLRVFYSPDYVGSAYAFATTRKAAWIADTLATAPIPGVELVEPRPLTREPLLRVHHADYVRAVETGVPRALAQSQGSRGTPASGAWSSHPMAAPSRQHSPHSSTDAPG